MERIHNLIAAFPYLLRHHVRSGYFGKHTMEGDATTATTAPVHQHIEERYRLFLTEPSKEVVDTRYEGDKSSGGVYRPEIVGTTPPRQCWVDRRDYPWSLLEKTGSSTLDRVAQAPNRPLWVCDRLGKEIMNIPYGPNFTSRERLTLLGNIDKLTNAIGECERIHQTAVPLNYARHALRSLTLWLFTLPFALVSDLGLLTGPVTGLIAWLMFGIYQIGHSIEDPFQGSLRLSILCDAIRRDVVNTDVTRQSAFGIDDAIDELEDLEDILPSQVKQEIQKVVLHQQSTTTTATTTSSSETNLQSDKGMRNMMPTMAP